MTRVAAEAGYGVSRLYPSQVNPDARGYAFQSLVDRYGALEVVVHGQVSGRVYVRLPYWGRNATLATSTAGRRMAEATARTVNDECTIDGVTTVYTLDDTIEQYWLDGRVDEAVAVELFRRLEELHRYATRYQHRAWSKEEPLNRLADFVDYVNALSEDKIGPEAARELTLLARFYYDYDLNTGAWTYGAP